MTTVEETRTAAWYPTQAHLDRSRLRSLMLEHGVETVDAWRSWAAEDIGRYWDTAVQDLDLQFTRPYTAPVDLSQGKPWPRWFVDGGFNYVHNALDRFATGPRANDPAVIWEGDPGDARTLSFADVNAGDRDAGGDELLVHLKFVTIRQSGERGSVDDPRLGRRTFRLFG